VKEVDREAYLTRYGERYERFGYDPRTLGWGAGGRQELRFAALAGIAGERREGSVLDVGCGFADLEPWLEQAGWRGSYTGVDIVPVLLEEARRQRPGVEVHLCDVTSEDPPGGPFDYVFASGVFNARLEGEGNEDYLRAALARLFSLARVGVAIDFMTTLVDFQHPGAWHTDPAWALREAQDLTRRVTLRHDYLPYEFCLYLYRDAEIEHSRYARSPGGARSPHE